MMSLIDNLTRAGKVPEVFDAPGGYRMVILPFGGRVLALYPPGSGESFLWANPALATPESAEAYFHCGGWRNPGGDRTWLAPEIELFIEDLARPAATYAVPAVLDPGNWILADAASSGVRLTQTTRLRLHRAMLDVGIRLEKFIRPAADPLPDSGLAYAGYSQTTTLEVEPSAKGAMVLGIWNLLQLPSPGTMLIGTRAVAAPQTVFGRLSDNELTIAQPGVRWEMGPPGADAKIALRADALTGRAGHLRRNLTTGSADLVVREFTVVPGADYVDALWEPPHETGWIFQACCVRNGTERFNELEYHAPAANSTAGPTVSRDESRVWAFRGEYEAVMTAADALLGNMRSRPCTTRRTADPTSTRKKVHL